MRPLEDFIHPGSPEVLRTLLRDGTHGRLGKDRLDALWFLIMQWRSFNVEYDTLRSEVE